MSKEENSNQQQSNSIKHSISNFATDVKTFYNKMMNTKDEQIIKYTSKSEMAHNYISRQEISTRICSNTDQNLNFNQ